MSAALAEGGEVPEDLREYARQALRPYRTMAEAIEGVIKGELGGRWRREGSVGGTACPDSVESEDSCLKLVDEHSLLMCGGVRLPPSAGPGPAERSSCGRGMGAELLGP